VIVQSKAAFQLVLCLVGLLWLSELVDYLIAFDLDQFGIFPRRLDNLWGITVWPFLHGDFLHLIANTLPLAVMGFFLALRGVKTFLLVSIVITLLAGLGVWIFGRPAYHIGASGLVFGYFGFLLGIAWYEKSVKAIFIACLTLFLYGGIVWGVLPSDQFVSWEGHLAGLVAGLFSAKLMASTIRPRREDHS
jgi:membrane associated rhomboid family serine protease